MPSLDLSNRRTLVTGASGFMGRNLTPLLKEAGAVVLAPSHAEYDLLDQAAVRRMFHDLRPEVVFHLAGLVGGILANRKSPADYSYQNLLMGTLMLHEAHRAGVSKYITLIGGCSYPALAPSPISEGELWNGYPQAESAPYSTAKKMAVVLAQAYRAQHGFDAVVLVPGNVYGPWDNFDLENSHVIPALIRKYHEAKLAGVDEIVAWGTGRPTRDFIFASDACAGIVKAAQVYSGPEIINISAGVAITIRELVETVAHAVGFKGQVRWDGTKPDGQMAKGFDVTRMREWLGFEATTPLREGIRRTYEWYLENPGAVKLKTAL